MELSVSLGNKAKQYRRELFEKFLLTGQGHPGSTFSMLEIVVCLYHRGYVRLYEDSKTFIDKVLISKGHATVALYPILADLGVLPMSEWHDWGNGSSVLRVFGNLSIPGIDMTSGSLGHGVGVGVGMAIANRASGSDSHTYVIISEGELYEGSTWEAGIMASHYSLGNLTVIVDVNSLIILGTTSECLQLESIEAKFAALGFNVLTVDGHSFTELEDALSSPNGMKPKCIIARTVKGKGFSMMENQPQWHYWNSLTEEQISTCRREIA